MNKYDHVRNAKQTRGHGCHWPGCPKQVPPAMWGCAPHWFRLPARLRSRIWATYRAGQEETLTPSTAYLDAADEVQRWILEHEAQRRRDADEKEVEYRPDPEGQPARAPSARAKEE